MCHHRRWAQDPCDLVVVDVVVDVHVDGGGDDEKTPPWGPSDPQSPKPRVGSVPSTLGLGTRPESARNL